MPTTDPISVRGGVARLLEWLTHHPAIPISYISHVDDLSAELHLPTGRFEALAAAAAVADALSSSRITVSDTPDRHLAELDVWGPIRGERGPALDLVAKVVVHDTARARLLSSLGVPPLPSKRSWTVTAEHLRGLVEAASAPAGA